MDFSTNIKLGLFRKLGTALLEKGISILKNAFSITEKIINYGIFLETLKQKIPNCSFSLLDGRYFLITYSQWLDILKLELLDYKTWAQDRWDCDKFARSFATYIYQIFEINSCGVVYGRVYNKDTNVFIDYHYWNVFLTKEDNGEIKVYFLEPGLKSTQSRWVEYNGTGQIIIGNMRYEIISIIF